MRSLEIELVFILGDLTDLKDRHPSKLVNRIVDNLMLVEADFAILKGNHDYRDPDWPFFHFLRVVGGQGKVEYFRDPGLLPLRDYKVVMIPHTNDIVGARKSMRKELEKADYVFLHHTFKGAIASNGHELDGTNASLFAEPAGGVFSGDIHVPQSVGNVEYVGAPYVIRFGDTYEPRLIVLDIDTGDKEDLHYPSIRKESLSLTDPDEIYDLDLYPEDMVKVSIETRLRRHIVREKVMRICEELGVQLEGLKIITPLKVKKRAMRVIKLTTAEDTVRDFGKHEKLGRRIVDRGVALL